ncbi:hypothetical protein DH2020_045489 [Rehmannia glutinosa]|uniref:F-box domain-containing protein n=1 Tax=Rehmannia glutinosa TaxID=99300 RepID=A0ABR0UFN5_REHGL
MESNKKAAVVVVQLPTEILEEILSRLRVKDLIRFKSVCKTWCQVISSQHLIQQHLNKSVFRAIHYERWVFGPCKSFITPKEKLPRDNLMEFVGSCDGLVCRYNRTQGIIHLSNPAIRKTACIPTKRPLYLINCFWFGRGDSDDEYKLIIGNTSHMHLIRPYIDNGSWKSTQKIQKTYRYFERIGTLYNGTVHWPVNGSYALSSCTILSYDLQQETIGEIPGPPMIRQTHHSFTIGEVIGCLSAMLLNNKFYEIWVMKEYGIRESWTKLMILPFQFV